VYFLLRNLVKFILLVQSPFIKRCSCVLVIQSLSVPECRTDLVSNLVSLLFLPFFPIAVYFGFPLTLSSYLLISIFAICPSESLNKKRNFKAYGSVIYSFIFQIRRYVKMETIGITGES